MADDEVTDRISEVVNEPAKASGDLGSVENQPIPDLIDADKYLKNNAATTGSKAPRLTINRLVPPGASG